MLDVLIKNGRILDGTGKEPVNCDIGLIGDKIEDIGDINSEAKKMIDAKNLFVSPGFIDIHTHSDFFYFLDSKADSKISQGVTFEFVGNCGLSFCGPVLSGPSSQFDTRLGWFKTNWHPDWKDFPGYLNALENIEKPLNVATQIGHNTVRQKIMGMQTHSPDPTDIRKMQFIIEEALESGAMGFSTGLSMPPGIYSHNSEVIQLVEIVASKNKLYSSHIRDSNTESCGLFVATQELIEAGRRTGARLQYSHIKAGGPMRGRSKELANFIEDARNEGIDIAADQYPYDAASGPMSGNVLPRWASEGGREKSLDRIKDIQTRKEIIQGLDESIIRVGGPERIMIAQYPYNFDYECKSIVEISEEENITPAEVLLNIYKNFDATLILRGMSYEDVKYLSSISWVAVGSDGSALSSKAPLNEGNPHPRSFGTFPKFFKDMVKKGNVVSVQEAVRKMTSLPAIRLELKKRGLLKKGNFADICIFSLDEISDEATFKKPHQYSRGIEHVIVNGVFVVENSKRTENTPGRLIRSTVD